MSQTSVAEQAAYFAGQKADARDDLVVSAVAEGAVPFGKLVVRGTDPEKQGLLPSAAGDVTGVKGHLGISLQSHAMESKAGAGDPTYADEEMMSLLRRGAVAVQVEEAVDTTDDVYVRYAAGGDGLGSFRASDPGSEAAILPGAKYVRAAGAGGIALVEVNLAG